MRNATYSTTGTDPMHDPKMIELIEVLLTRTRQRRVDWRPRSEISDDAFEIVQKNSVITLSRRALKEGDIVDLVVRDENGRTVSKISSPYKENWDKLAEIEWGHFEVPLSELFYLAQRQALKTDVVIDEIISSFR